MGYRLPNLNWLRAFECAARLRSFTAAGEELHLTQAAVIPKDLKNDPSDVEGLSFGEAHCAARCGASGKRCNDGQRANIPHRRPALPELRTSLRPSRGARHHVDDRA